MKRVAIHVAMSPHGDGEPDITIVCNDGTMWMLGHTGQWIELPAIPQQESCDPLAKLYRQNVDMRDKLEEAKQIIENVRRDAERLIAREGVGHDILALVKPK